MTWLLSVCCYSCPIPRAKKHREKRRYSKENKFVSREFVLAVSSLPLKRINSKELSH
jgi:hypothetical protein